MVYFATWILCRWRGGGKFFGGDGRVLARCSGVG